MTPEIEALRAAVRPMLLKPDPALWTLQGFGMLRTYLDEAKRFRLHVWDSSLATKDVSTIHDHPWHFRSYVLAGKIYNQRYLRTDATDNKGHAHWQQAIRCGEGGGAEGEPELVFLRNGPAEVYHPGDVYTQRASELHSTTYA